MAAEGSLYVVAAPSGAGKTSLVRELLQRLDNVEVSVSYTTRPPRPGERDGVDYHFIDTARFQALIDANELLEYAQVLRRDYFYGTGRDVVRERLAAGIDLILEIDWQGARRVRELLPECIGVFILPPSKAVLEQRLRKRGQDSEAVIAERMSAAVDEMSHYPEFDYLVVNDAFEATLDALRAIFLANRQRRARVEVRERALLDALLDAG